MKRFAIALILVLAFSGLSFASTEAADPTPGARPVVAATGTPIPDQYIVPDKAWRNPRAVAAIAGLAPHYVYTAALNGFAAQLTAGQLNALQRQADVELIEQDQEVTIADTQTMDPSGDPWGLDRIDQRALP